MSTLARTGLATWVCLLAGAVAAAVDLSPMKFNDVREVAPGIFFRYSSISATDPSVPFGGCNNIWIVTDEGVVVFDANFPKEAGDVIAAIRKTTDKPIRYVLDSHHHGDHAYGNAVFAKAGAAVVAQANCARWLRTDGPREFADAGKGKGGRPDVRDSSLKVPGVEFTDKLVLDDGKQRVEMLFLGHAHTPGDAVLYLPKHKLVCTGDACVNGAFNFMGHSDSASWVRVLERVQQLDVQTVCPGHGPLAGKDLLERQKRYFVELREYVRRGLDAGQGVEDLIKRIDLPWYKEWTGVKPPGDNVRHVYAELTGRAKAWDLEAEFGAPTGPAPKDAPGWTKPRRIVVPNLMPARRRELKLIAPEVEFVPVKTADDAVKAAEDADAVLGFATAEVLKAGRKLRWVHAGSDGVGKDLLQESHAGRVVLTDARRAGDPANGKPAAEGYDRPWRLLRENVRRFAAGEPLLGVVDRAKGD
jgi:cyclase